MSVREPLRLLERRFTVGVSLESAWAHLERVEQWPSWARHIRSIELSPPGPLVPDTAGVIRLTNGVRSTFRMEVIEEIECGRRWSWAGPFLGVTVHYDHRFTRLGSEQTEIVFVLDGEGFGVSVLGRLFARIYARNLDRAIPNLIEELERGGAG